MDGIEHRSLYHGITAHTISQRLRSLKKIPPELIPLGMNDRLVLQALSYSIDIFVGIVVGIAVGAAAYSMGRKLVVDKQMRLTRQNRKE